MMTTLAISHLVDEYVTARDILVWVLILILVLIAYAKVWPWVRKIAHKEETAEDLPARIEEIEHRMNKYDEKFDRDYAAINEIKRELRRQAEENNDSLKERGIMMRSLLATLDGLHQLGANGNTTEMRMELQQFINDQAHKIKRQERGEQP